MSRRSDRAILHTLLKPLRRVSRYYRSTMSHPPAWHPAVHAVVNTLCWFEDGNIVLRAENTLFRVHKGLLQKQSALFDDLFSLPISEDTTDTYEGCPLIVVQETADEMEVFIRAIVDLTSVALLCRACAYRD